MIRLMKRVARKILNKVDEMRAAARERRLPHNPGYCNVCESETEFIEYKPWLRGNYKCKNCQSLPRNRALINVIYKYAKKWKEMDLHESSPSGVMSAHLKKHCK